MRRIAVILMMLVMLCDAADMQALRRRSKSRKPARTSAPAPKPKAPSVAEIPVAEETMLMPKHEMRGAWLASVYGIDWPSRQGTGADVAAAQRLELCRILDVLQKAGINAVLLQVRSMSDAFYPSSLEPWSRFLTGTRGEAPAEGWDPLEVAVSEAHARGMELHAWVNPFRLAGGTAPEAAPVARGKGTFDPVARGWVLTWRKPGNASAVSVLDPGNPEARKHIVEVCREIVSRYDVDGLVFDDYFYPDALPLGKGYDFAEYQRYVKHHKGSEPLSQADWRRDNVARTVADVHAMLEKGAPWVRFGISPAGVAGGNGASAVKYGLRVPQGSDWMYDRIFCDPLQWLAEGTVDYVSPQLYWTSLHATNPYEPLASWWGDVAVRFGRHVWPSQSVGTIPEGEAAWAEQGFEVGINRRCADAADAGSIFYSTAHLTGKKMKGLGDYLATHCYRAPALMPPMRWKEAPNPGSLSHLELSDGVLCWESLGERMRYVVYAVPETVEMLDALSGTDRNFSPEYIAGISYTNSFVLPAPLRKGYRYAVAPYDRYGNEWDASILTEN